MFIYIYIYIYIKKHLCVCVCVYIYIYIYIYIYKQICEQQTDAGPSRRGANINAPKRCPTSRRASRQARKPGHLTFQCQTGRDPKINKNPMSKSQGAIAGNPAEKRYCAFTSRGVVYCRNRKGYKINILRDTGASQSLLIRNHVPISACNTLNKTVMIRGIGIKPIKVPLYQIEIKSKWKSGPVVVGIIDRLPMTGVSMLLRNDIGGDRI